MRVAPKSIGRVPNNEPSQGEFRDLNTQTRSSCKYTQDGDDWMFQERTALAIHYHILKIKDKYTAHHRKRAKEKVKFELCNYIVIIVSAVRNPIST